MYNYTLQATQHATFDFDPTTWVVWANSQFVTVSGVFLPSFLPFFVYFGSPTSRAGGCIVSVLHLLDVFCAKDVPLGVRIFNFHIFAYVSPKIVKINPEIGNFQPK